VTVRRQNQAPLTYNGTLTTPATPGEATAGTPVTTFTY
jgi:hypothetical protein